MTEDELKTPSIGISYQIQTRQSRTLVLQSFIERDCEPAAFNALLDKMRDAAERQQAWEKIDDLRLQIKQEYINAQNNQTQIEKADASIKANWENGKRKGDVRLTQSEIQKQRQAWETAEAIKERIVVLKEALENFEAKVAS